MSLKPKLLKSRREKKKRRRLLHAGELALKSKTKSGLDWVPSQVRISDYWSGGLYTNLVEDDEKIWNIYREGTHDNSGFVFPEHHDLLQRFNSEASKRVGKSAILPAGVDGEASYFYVEYHGRREIKGDGSGNILKTRRLAKAVAEIASEYPFIIEPCIGDISGEGDYVTTLMIWRNEQ